jgi:hypothetical protein
MATTSDAIEQASSGMYAFGDAMIFVGVFGTCALLPTGAALYFLRPYSRFWTVISRLGIAVAVTGVTAAVVFVIGRDAPPSSLATWAAFAVLRILVAPVLGLTFLVCTLLSPHRAPRLTFLTATVMEAAVTVFAGLVWVVLPMLRH